MNIAKIKRACLEHEQITLLHTEEGDWIGDGTALWTCDGMRFSADQVSVMMGLTPKQRSLTPITECTPADLNLAEEDFCAVSDADDVALAEVCAVSLDHGKAVVAYQRRDLNLRELRQERYLIGEGVFAPVETRDGPEIGLRTALSGEKLIVAARGYIAVGICRPGFGADAEARIASKLEEYARIIRGEKKEEAEHDGPAGMD